MPNKFEGPRPQGDREKMDQEVREKKRMVVEIADRYTASLEGYADDEKVVASMGTVGTSVVLEAGRLRKYIHEMSIDAMNSIGMGEDSEEALKKLWGGKLIILSPEKSKEFLSGVQQLLETKPELEKFLKPTGEGN